MSKKEKSDSSIGRAQKRLNSLQRQLHQNEADEQSAQASAYPVVIGACICDIQVEL